MRYELKTGIDKNKNNWYSVIFIVNKYKTDMIFIDELYYDYLLNLQGEDIEA